MNKYSLNQISLLQYIFLIHGSQITGTMFALPHLLAKEAGPDGWISIMIGWLLTSAASLIIIQVMKRYPDGTLLDLLEHYFGKWAGRIGAGAVALYFLYFTYAIIVYQILYVKLWILSKTPDLALLILFMLPGYYVAVGGFPIAGRFAVVGLTLILFTYLSYTFPFSEGTWINLLPVLQSDAASLIAGTKHVISPFLGFETTFILYPFLKKKEKAAMGIVAGSLISFIILLFVTLACFVYFSPNEILHMYQPGLSVLRSIELPFLQVVISIYLLAVTITWITTILCSSFSAGWMIGAKDHRGCLRLFLAAIIGIYLFYKPTYNQNVTIGNSWTYIGFGFAYVFPLLLWLLLAAVDVYRKKQGVRSNHVQ